MSDVILAVRLMMTKLPRVPAPELESDTVAHGYARGSTRLHVPFVYHVHKSVLFDKDNVKVRLEDADDEDESPQDEPDETHSKHGSSRTLISLPNNPFARLSPLKADYYKYGRSPVKGYLPKSFLKLERLRDVQVPAGQHRSMLLFE
ncbi:hypothetical protein BIW11_03391 [Tropilaelaps mercedesae]|uniref:Uncharacterized protein n=1 Tax=Tropilaelaps mercedesae TaxID=418985 RepID=A0A1V9XMB8_9ACAR|nr:hypothetical protein BIW11_03391 [Tropilaelaps mercedesae]